MNDYIYHHGIKGMKWGIRRTPEELGHAPSKSSKDMSDEELRKRVNRLQMEKQYKQLMNELYPDKKARAAKFISNFLSSTTKGVAKFAWTAFLSSLKDDGKKNDDYKVTNIDIDPMTATDKERQAAVKKLAEIKSYNSLINELDMNTKIGKEYVDQGFMTKEEMEKAKWLL